MKRRYTVTESLLVAGNRRLELQNQYLRCIIRNLMERATDITEKLVVMENKRNDL